MNKIISFFIIFLLLTLSQAAISAEIILSPTTVKATTSAVTTIPATVSPLIFTRYLTAGSYGKDVMALKKIISYEFVEVPDTSPTFTTDTVNDVNRLQEKYAAEILTPNNLTAGTGTVGPATRKKLNQLVIKFKIKLSDFVLPVSAKTSVSTDTQVRNTFSTNLKFGSYGDDVSLLKIVLNSDEDTKVVSTSADLSNVFDLDTLSAVKKFQEKYKIATFVSAGYGQVGPMTRTKLNYILNNILNNIQTTSATTSVSSAVVSTTGVLDYMKTVSVAPTTLSIANKSDSAAPIITLMANPAQVSIGEATTLEWKATNITGKCNIASRDSLGVTLGSTIDSSGAKSTGPIKTSTTYSVVCYNKYGIPGSKKIFVEVIDPTKIIAAQKAYTQAPAIISVSPSSGKRGDIVNIKGSGFLSSNSIFFDGTKIDSGLIISQSSSTISFRIPQYKACLSVSCLPPTVDTVVETGGQKNIQVSNTNGYSNDSAFTLPYEKVTIPGVSVIVNYTPPKLAITSIKPTTGNRGDIVTISGSGFSTDSIVLFGGFKVADNLIVSKTGASIQFTVPPFQMGCTEPDYEICPRLPLPGTGLIIETGGIKNVYIMNISTKATTTAVEFTLPSKKIVY